MCKVKEKLFKEDVKLRYDLLINECKTNLSLDVSDQSCGRQSTNAVTDEFCQTWIPCTLNDPIPTSPTTLPPTKPTKATEAPKGTEAKALPPTKPTKATEAPKGTEAKALPPTKSSESPKDIDQTSKGQSTRGKGHQTPSITPSTTKSSSTVKVMSKGSADSTTPGIALLVTVFVFVIN